MGKKLRIYIDYESEGKDYKSLVIKILTKMLSKIGIDLSEDENIQDLDPLEASSILDNLDTEEEFHSYGWSQFKEIQEGEIPEQILDYCKYN